MSRNVETKFPEQSPASVPGRVSYLNHDKVTKRGPNIGDPEEIRDVENPIS